MYLTIPLTYHFTYLHWLFSLGECIYIYIFVYSLSMDTLGLQKISSAGLSNFIVSAISGSTISRQGVKEDRLRCSVGKGTVDCRINSGLTRYIDL